MALSQREKLLLVVPVALGGLFVFYTYVHEPLFTRRAAALEKSDQVKSDLARDKSRLAREGDLKSRKEAVAAREQVIDAWVPGKNSAALFIWYLSQAEARSSARIKKITVSEKKLVTPSTMPGAKNQSGAAGQPVPPANKAQPQQQPGAKAQQTGVEAEPTLAMITLNLLVDARFAEHLLFNQAIEEMPLFLATNQLELEKNEKQPATERAGKLVGEGNSWLAVQVLRASPALDGKYQINLYFKADKVGPTTEPMQFLEATGRMDPFVMAGVDEFVRLLMEHYTYQQGLKENNTPGEGRNMEGGPGSRNGQLG